MADRLVNGLLIGLAFVAIGAWLMYSDYVASTWNPVEGRIISSAVATISPEGVYGRTTYQADIQYGYSVGGKEYTGSCCQEVSTNAGDAGEMVNKHSPNDTAQIMVDPNDPNQSKLTDDIQPSNWVHIMMILVGVLLIAAYVYLRQRSK